MVYTERAEMAAVSHGTSHVTVKERCKYNHFGGYSKTRYKKLVTHVESRASAVSLFESGEWCYIKAINNNGLRAQSQGRHTIARLEERDVERGSERRSSLKRTREGHCQSEEHWNRLKGNVGETSERRGGAHMSFSERIDTILD